jgi:hypothetical protein
MYVPIFLTRSEPDPIQNFLGIELIQIYPNGAAPCWIKLLLESVQVSEIAENRCNDLGRFPWGLELGIPNDVQYTV